MRYHHLLTLIRRSKHLDQFVSHTRCIHQTTFKTVEPSITRNKYGINAIASSSNRFLQSTHSSFNPAYYNNFQVSSTHTSVVQPLSSYNCMPLDYPVTLKGRDVILATKTNANQHWLALSNLDLLLPPIEAGVFFCYKNKNNINMSPETVVKTIKKSLAGVLSIFYPLAGEIVQNIHGEPEVVCNNGGVEFVHAHADVELKDLDFHHPDHSVRGKLVPRINHGLLSVQVTELKCGSIILSCAVNHQLSDGHSLNKFLVAWAEYTRSAKIPNIPSFRPSILNPRHPPRYDTSFDNLYIPITSLPPQPSFEEPLDSRMYYIRAESIARIQSEASTQETKKSKFLSFTAYLWKLLADGNNGDTSSISRMGVVVNGRRFLTQVNEKDSSSSFENHYGNVLSVPYGIALNRDLKAMTLNEVANMVQGFVGETTNEEHFRGLVDWVQFHRPTPAVTRIYFKHEKEDGWAVVVSSGQGLPVNELDFGWGNPEFGSYHFPWGGQTGYVTTMPSARRNGDWVVYMHLNQKEFQVIDRMAPNVFTPFSMYA